MNHKKLIVDIRAKGLTVEQIAKALKVKPVTIYRYIKADRIQGKRVAQLKALASRIDNNDLNGLKAFDSQALVSELSKRGWKVTLTAKD
jgi:IS30 family transposase